MDASSENWNTAMLEKETAIRIKAHAHRAINELLEALESAKEHCSPEMFATIKRGVGISIGNIDVDLMVPIYRIYPELDDVAQAFGRDSAPPE